MLSKIIRIFFLSYIVCVPLLSCRMYSPWMQISKSSYDYIRYNQTESTVWLASKFSQDIDGLVFQDDKLSYGEMKKIKTTENFLIGSMCISNDSIWISSFVLSKEPNFISIYTFDNKKWETLIATPSLAECKPLKDGGVVFWSRDEIIVFHGARHEYKHTLITGKKIYDIVDDAEGNMWVSTYDGDLYKQSGENWVLIESPSPSRTLFIDNNGDLWMTSRDTYVYKYSASISHPAWSEVFSSQLGHWQDMFQDNSGAIWLITENSLMMQKNGEFQKIDPPLHSEVLSFGAFDVKTNILFIETEEGVFTLDLDNLSLN